MHILYLVKDIMKLRTFFMLIATLCLLVGCDKKAEQFTVHGVVAGADGTMLYFENVGLTSVTLLDSVKLRPDGKFSFKEKRPQYPDFYRLRLNDQLINFAIDSTENIKISADSKTFAISYTIEGSENCVGIKNITLAQLDATQEINRLRREFNAGTISDTVFQRQAQEAIDSYKEIARKYIYSAPQSTTAYYAIFQQIEGLLLFDLYDKADTRAYGAVATSYNHFYPESPRSKHLYNLALQAIAVTRNEKINLEDIPVREVSFLEIELPDIKDKNVALSAIAKDKVVILNFTSYQGAWSPELNFELREIYDKFHSKGLEIYQISLDNDVHLWKNAAANLPWICVRDPQSAYSPYVEMYNVKQLPTMFILNKKGVLSMRIEDMSTLEKSVEKLF